jgi:histidine triad (HIT) family protein
MTQKDCIIDQIILKKAPASIIYEDDSSIVFLDHRPIFLGHTLVAPKTHIKNIHDLPYTLIEPFFSLVKTIAKAVEIAMEAEGSFIAMNNTVSQSIPHLHIHIVPRNKGDGLKGFFWPRTKYANHEEMMTIKTRIQNNL